MTTIAPRLRSLLALSAAALVLWAYSSPDAQDSTPEATASDEATLQVHYLEIVTDDVDATCSALEELHGVTFSEPDDGLGSARTAKLRGGGAFGVRAPMAAHETPVVRPYLLVDDIEAAVKAAAAAGGEIAMGATPIPGQGKFAIYFQGGIQYGLWEN